MAGLLSVGQGYKSNAFKGLSTAASLEEQREQTKEALDAADSAQMKSNVGLGAGMGYMASGSIGSALGIGGAVEAGTGLTAASSLGGPIGMAVGALGGFLFSKLF